MRFSRDERGTSVVEFALALPVLLLMASGFIEIGRAHLHAETVEKSIRGAAEYAARNEFPLTAAAKTNIENLVRTGTVDGSGLNVVPGFDGADGVITITTASVDLGTGNAVPVVRIAATIPYRPVLSGLMAMAGLDTFSIEVSHDQPYIGT